MPHPTPSPPSPLQTLNTIFAQLATLSAVHIAKYSEPLNPALNANTNSTNTGPNKKAQALPDKARPLLLTLHVLFPHLLLPALDLLDRGLVTRIVLAPSHGASHDLRVLAHEITSTSILSNHPSTSTSTSTRFNRRSYGSSNSDHANPDTNIDTNDSDGKKYHVHLKGWSCDCPAFALAAFSSDPDPSTSELEGNIRAAEDGTDHCDDRDASRTPYGLAQAESTARTTSALGFGGLMIPDRYSGVGPDETEKLPSLCKHILAAALGEWCGGFFGVKEDVDGGGDGRSGGEGGAKGRARGMRERVVMVEEAAGWAAGASL